MNHSSLLLFLPINPYSNSEKPSSHHPPPVLDRSAPAHKYSSVGTAHPHPRGKLHQLECRRQYTFLCFQFYRLHSLLKLLKSAPFSPPPSMRLLLPFVYSGLFCHMLHFILGFSRCPKWFSKISCIEVLCVVQFHRFWQMYNVLCPLLQGHTEKLHCSVSPVQPSPHQTPTTTDLYTVSTVLPFFFLNRRQSIFVVAHVIATTHWTFLCPLSWTVRLFQCCRWWNSGKWDKITP